MPLCLILLLGCVLASGAEAGQLYVVRPDGSDARRVTQDDDWAYGSPNWSPDGKRIAVDTWPEPAANSTSRFSNAGASARQLVEIGLVDFLGGPTKRIGHGAMPSWSPQGDQLVCHTYAPTNQIVVFNLDGSGREVLLNQWGCPRWSPDGGSIFTVHRSGIARYDLASGKQTSLISSVGMREGFHYHPATHRFCCRTVEPSLIIVEQDKTIGGWKERVRIRSASEIGHASWSPEGEKIVFRLGSIRGHCRLAVVDADSPNPPVDLPGLPSHWKCCNPRWSPDGEWIAFIRLDSPEFEETHSIEQTGR